MILTVTLNPLLERRLIYKEVKAGKEHRKGREKLSAGGKGVNVSRQLGYLNIQNHAFTFLGGTNGKILRDQLKRENINFSSVNTASETRWAAVVIDEFSRKVTTFFSANSQISSSEAEEFLSRLDKMIQNCEIVIFSGSSPSPETDFIFPSAVKLANKYDKISICDTYGNHLNDCINSSPTILHNNINETEKSLNISLESGQEKIDYLNSLYEKGIKQVYLTDGAKNSYASNFDFHFKVKNPSVTIFDETGSGDAFVAGIVYGFHNNFTFEETLSIAVALGSLNAQSIETCKIPLNSIDSLKGKVKISPIGKKMKIVDVTPG